MERFLGSYSSDCNSPTDSEESPTRTLEKSNHIYDALRDLLKKMQTCTRCKKTALTPVNKEQSTQYIGKQTLKVKPFSTEELMRLIMNFLINSLTPVKILDDPAIQRLFIDVRTTERDLEQINSQAMAKLLDEDFNCVIGNLMYKLNSAIRVFYSVNEWTNLRLERALVITAHWIDENFNRKSATLGIKRTYRTRDPMAVKQILDEIQYKYCRGNIQYTTTQNQSSPSMLSALSGYNVSDLLADETYPYRWDWDFDFSDPKYFSLANLGLETNLDELRLCNEDLRELNLNVMCCPGKNLNLYMLVDVATAITNLVPHLRQHVTSVVKCERLWINPHYQRIVKDLTGITPIIPLPYEWLSIYHGIKDIISVKLHMNDICAALRINEFDGVSLIDCTYLEEHIACMKPFAQALEALQNPDHSFFGSLIPILFRLRAEVYQLSTQKWPFGHELLLDMLIRSLDSGFAEFYKFGSKYALKAGIAALSHPLFKNYWLLDIDSETQTKIMTVFRDAVRRELLQLPMTERIVKGLNQHEITLSEDQFFSFNGWISANENQKLTEIQIQKFFKCNDTNLNCLIHFPVIRSVFMKYNAPVSSFSFIETTISQELIHKFIETKTKREQHVERRILHKLNKYI